MSASVPFPQLAVPARLNVVLAMFSRGVERFFATNAANLAAPTDAVSALRQEAARQSMEVA